MTRSRIPALSTGGSVPVGCARCSYSATLSSRSGDYAYFWCRAHAPADAVVFRTLPTVDHRPLLSISVQSDPHAAEIFAATERAFTCIAQVLYDVSHRRAPLDSTTTAWMAFAEANLDFAIAVAERRRLR